MLRWNNDYNHGAHPSILEAFAEYNDESYGGYGIDPWCERASDEIQKHLGGVDCDIHFLVGGTQVNFVVAAAALRPYQGIISAETGHINVHETGAIENTGHKILTVPGKDGKLSANEVRAIAEEFATSGIKEHITMPKLVYISFPTEFGTVYTRGELQEIRKVCDEYDLMLHIDGARMSYGVASSGSDVSLSDIAKFADVFYIGGTKCGTMFGEAVVIKHPVIRENFRSYVKQNGAMLAKGWTLGLQFFILFSDNRYLEIAGQAVKMAMEIKNAFIKKGIPFYCDSPTNQQFVIVSEAQMEALAKKHIFEYQCPLEDGKHCIRFCTSWSTKTEDVEVLVQDILAL